MTDNQHIIYSASDIHRYFSGKMNAGEMYAMEKAALNDPLLADAMDGYHSLAGIGNEKDFESTQKQLDELKDKISGKTSSIKKYNNKWWKVAAAVLLLMGSVYAFYQLNNTSNNKEKHDVVTQQTTSNSTQIKPVMDSVAAKQDSSIVIETDSAKEKTTIAKADSKINKTVIESAQADISQPPSEKPSSIIAADSISMDDFNRNAERDMAQQQVASNTPQLKQYDEYYAKDLKKERREIVSAQKNGLFKKTKAILFAGKVTDENNNAIPYANLIINNHQQATTDANGLFNLSLPDSIIRLDVSAKNYYPKTTTITPANFAGIVLDIKKNTLKKRQSLTDTFARSQVQVLYKTGVEPKEGWVKYELFLINEFSNSEYDDGRLVTGETIVRFEIDRNMQPTNFTFEKSIDQDVNDAIETLILTGPEWRIAENGGIPGIVELRIIF